MVARGTRIAFVSERGADPDRSNDSNIYVIEAKAGATPTQLTTFVGPDRGRPAWSPDGRWIAYTQGDEPKMSAYNLGKLAVVPAASADMISHASRYEAITCAGDDSLNVSGSTNHVGQADRRTQDKSNQDKGARAHGLR